MPSANGPAEKKPLRISSAEDRAKIPKVVLAVHGIRDFGEWREEVRRELEKQGIVPIKVTYGTSTCCASFSHSLCSDAQ